ncbi:DUF6551 family protein [Jatrophihabitans endophyticus]|uniref:DUF6551 family protein n=1 Tax=Jatrophihabitans endophyticus TaxID=1206085 RepID=UPI001A0E01DD|nr:DUF6551 family protein [Jatrophihabitans endophyticus]MBE7190693.1 hypothetical protein [Jatrophihabitans endophyticus]
MPDTTFITAIPTADLFVDSTYQRECDEPRTRRMAASWDPSLVGVLDVSDRGQSASPRYAIINGQHRWRAAILHDPQMSLVCNVHQGLHPETEAQLFWDIDRSTKKLTTWDRWKARRGAGDAKVLRIEQICRGVGAPVAEHGTYIIKSTSSLEQMYAIDEWGLTATIQMAVDVWPKDPAGLQGGILRGLMPVVMWCEPAPMSGRLADALAAITPSQVHARAVSQREVHRTGQFWTCVTRVVVELYNSTPGAGGRLNIRDVLNVAAPARGETAR